VSEVDTAAVIARFNDAFQKHDPALLDGLIAEDCVVENNSPAPDGARYLGRAACLAWWQGIAADTTSGFDLEDVIVCGDRATILWRFRFGDGNENSVRGVNLMLVRDNLIVEGKGYVKSG